MWWFTGKKDEKADTMYREDLGHLKFGDFEVQDLDDRGEVKVFHRLMCLCGRKEFEVLKTDEYETSARCACGRYFVVHAG